MTTLVGQIAPDFALPASNGQTVRLADFSWQKYCALFLSKRYDTRVHNRGV